MATESSQPSDITLPSIVTGHADLIYALPLLLVSLVLTFAGAFLTLDRTRSFASSKDDQESIIGTPPSSTKPKLLSWWVFEGGVGGLCGGWGFAAHLVAFLTLFLANRKNATLSAAQFLAIYIISSILCTVLAARFKWIAEAFIGLTGGVGFAMTLSVMLHPSLITRQIFVALFASLATIMSLLPIPRTQHGALRFASASAGSFGVVVSITLLAHKSSWQNVWERLWLPASVDNDWGTGVEHGFTVLACLLLILGIVCDWLLHTKVGENPEEKWDEYLSKYSKSVPNASDRAGIFEQSKNWWEKIFHHDTVPNIPTQPAKASESATDFSFSPSKVRSKRKPRSKRSKVEFRPLGDYSDSDSDSGSEFSKKTSAGTLDMVPELLPPPSRPWLSHPTSPSLSGPTLYDSDDEIDKSDLSKKIKVNLESYSDSEDITDTHLTAFKRLQLHRDEPGWKPGFLLNQTPTPTTPISNAQFPVAFTPPPGAVPMTPSLIRAIDRIAVAQSQAYPSAVPSFSIPVAPASIPREIPREHDDKWRGFWKHVQHKSAQS